MPHSKEKHTKEQVMRLLNHAIEQEEILIEKVKTLEKELADCRKKAENPRHEIENQALSKSKVSFRLDFYRMEEKGSLKGIIEHLPSRESRYFEEGRWSEIEDFLTQFVGPNTSTPLNIEGKKPEPVSTIKTESRAVVPRKGRNTLPQKQHPDVIDHANTTPKRFSDSIQMDIEPFLVLTQNSTTNQRAVKNTLPFQIKISKQVLEQILGKFQALKINAQSLDQMPNPGYEVIEHPISGQNQLQ